jgi:hypothetical protein
LPKPISKTSDTKWLFKPTASDVRMVEDERRRLTIQNPGVTITRADAMRSLFARGTATVPPDKTKKRQGNG